MRNERLFLSTIGQALAHVPVLDELKDALFAPLLSPFEVSSLLAAAAAAVEFRSSFIFKESEFPGDMDMYVASHARLAISCLTEARRSEMTWAQYHTEYMMNLLHQLSLHHGDQFSFTQNLAAQRGTLTILQDSVRPDFMACRREGLLLVIGEEKGERGDLGKARGELIQKVVVWDTFYMSNLPYLLCFATGADYLQFYAMTPASPVNTLVPLHEYPIVVTTTDGFLRMTVAAINIFRILMTLHANILPTGAPTLLSTIGRPNCTLIFEATGVRKIYHTAKSTKQHFFNQYTRQPFTVNDLDRLEAFFRRLAAVSPHPDCMELPQSIDRVDSNTLQVTMTPVGIMRKPINKQEFLNFLRCILNALVILCSLGYVHCDLRWSNIIAERTPHRGHWYLIDFGEATPISATTQAQHDLRKLADMLTLQADFALLCQDGFDFPVGELQTQLRNPSATAEGVLRWIPTAR